MSAHKNVKLGGIADILNGIPDSKQSTAEADAYAITYSLIQPNHLGVFNNIQGASVIKRQSLVGENYLVRNNDILLKRLNPDNVTLLNQVLSNTTFSSNLFVVRVREEYYPPYIACLLENQGLALLNSNLVGSIATVRSVSIKALAELDIPAIKYEKQKVIGQMWLLHKKRQKLLEDFKAEDQRLVAAAINSITLGAKEEE